MPHLLSGHSLSFLHWLNSILHSHVVIMVDTGQVPGFCRPRWSLRAEHLCSNHRKLAVLSPSFNIQIFAIWFQILHLHYLFFFKLRKTFLEKNHNMTHTNKEGENNEFGFHFNYSIWFQYQFYMHTFTICFTNLFQCNLSCCQTVLRT